MTKKTICFACSADVPDVEGPTHPYMLSSPGCWKLYSEMLALEYAARPYDATVNRITVDTYAVSHPGRNERRAVQSVNGHLISLYYILEKGVSGEQATKILTRTLASPSLIHQFTWLDPPTLTNTLHITEVSHAPTLEAHKALVRAWGKSVRHAWRAKHGSVVLSHAAQLHA